MTPAVIAEKSHAFWIVAAIALHAVLAPLSALGFVGDDGAEHETAENTGSNRAAVSAAAPATPTAPATSAGPAAPALNLNDQRIAIGLRHQILRSGAGQRCCARGHRAHQQTGANQCSSSV